MKNEKLKMKEETFFRGKFLFNFKLVDGLIKKFFWGSNIKKFYIVFY